MSAPRILLAEDERDIVTLMEFILERDGYAILTAADGAQALELVEREPDLDLLILNNMMPRLSGYGVLRELCGCGMRPIHRVIVTSASPPPPAFADWMLASGVPFLLKPFGAEELRRTVAAALARPAPWEEPWRAGSGAPAAGRVR